MRHKTRATRTVRSNHQGITRGMRRDSLAVLFWNTTGEADSGGLRLGSRSCNQRGQFPRRSRYGGADTVGRHCARMLQEKPSWIAVGLLKASLEASLLVYYFSHYYFNHHEKFKRRRDRALILLHQHASTLDLGAAATRAVDAGRARARHAGRGTAGCAR